MTGIVRAVSGAVLGGTGLAYRVAPEQSRLFGV